MINWIKRIGRKRIKRYMREYKEIAQFQSCMIAADERWEESLNYAVNEIKLRLLILKIEFYKLIFIPKSENKT